jgi:hypothetical protein
MAEKIGRPTLMTPETISKLEEVFSIGGSDNEACFYADIGKSTLYNYQQEHPEFVERKEALKERPILKARQTVVKGLDEADNAKWFLERKLKKEFANRQEVTGTDGKDLIPESLTPEEKQALLNLIK